MRRLTLIPLLLLLAGCGSSHSAHQVTVHVSAGTVKTFSSNALRAGDKVMCGRGGVAAVVQRPGSAVSAGSGHAGQTGRGSSHEIEIENKVDGTVVVKCGR